MQWPLVKVVHQMLGKPRVRAAIDRLPGRTVLETGYMLDARYELSFAGVLLTDQGEVVEKLMSLYLEYIRHRWEQEPALKRVEEEDVAAALQLTADQSRLLGRLIALGAFWGGGGIGDEHWDAVLPDDIDDLPYVSDLQAYVREKAAKLAALATPPSAASPRLLNDDTGTVPAPEKAASASCFVLMPFKDPFNGYYSDIIKPAIENVGLRAVRADEISTPGAIAQQIWREINAASLCVAELTDRNPNVMYELGLAHALAKPVVQIVQRIDDVPFDLRHLRHIVYTTQSARWAESLREELEKALFATLQDTASALAFPARGTPTMDRAGPISQ